jgi:hypothetical protein
MIWFYLVFSYLFVLGTMIRSDSFDFSLFVLSPILFPILLGIWFGGK